MLRYRRAVEDRGHRFIPFALLDLGRLGGHASSFLDELAQRRAERSGGEWWMLRPAVRRRMILERWMQMLSATVHLSTAGWVRSVLDRDVVLRRERAEA